MKIHSDLDQIPSLKKPIITIGTFDGIHLGHQKILSFLKSKAQEVNGESVVFTFHPHPRVVLHPNDHNLELIQTIDERVEKFQKMGIDNLIIFPFSKEFSRLSATQFVRDVLVNKLNLHTLVIGYDHHFGRNREGSMQNLQELAPLYDFDIIEISALIKEDTNISSTKIRKALHEGDIEKAKHFLGENYEMEGEVMRGDEIGTKLGFPTANLSIEAEYKLIPSNGVYAVKVMVDGEKHEGMLNIGNRPTILAGGEKRIEVNLFDFKADLYGKRIRLELIKYIREELEFIGLDALKTQLEKDEKVCRSVLHDYAIVN